MAEHAVKKSRGEEKKRRRGGGGDDGGGGEEESQADGRLLRPRYGLDGGAAQTGLQEVFHVYGPAEMSSLLLLCASQLIRTPPSARGTNKKR